MDEKTPQTDPVADAQRAKKSAGLSLGATLSIALVAGGLTGVAGLYAMGAFESNGVQHRASVDTGEADGSFEQEAEALKPLLTGDIAAMLARSDNKVVGDLGFNDADGNPLTLADTGEGYRLVNLWATWCAPCREEMPWLDQLQADKGSEKFKVVAISVDGGSDEKPKEFYAEIGIENLPFYQDPTIGVFNRLRQEGLAFGLPVTFLVDSNNRVIANMNGPAHWSGADAYALVDGLLER